MTLMLYELCGADDRRFSPYCWRVRMALAHKGLEADLVGVRFTDKHLIAFSGQTLVPVLVDGAAIISDSWAIACHLEAAYADRPALFGGEAARRLCRFVNLWADRVLQPGLFPLIVADILAIVDPADRGYFRTTREKRVGRRLEDVQGDREGRVHQFRASLAPLRSMVEEQPFLCGDAPAFADYIVFGSYQWARCVSAFPLLDPDDPVYRWRARMLGLFDGLAGKAKGYPC